MTTERDELIARLWGIADPQGTRRRDNARWRATASNPASVELLQQRGVWSELEKLLLYADEMDSLHAAAADTILCLAPLGWAPSAWMPIDACTQAVSAQQAGEVEHADAILAEAWSAPPMLRHPGLQMYSLESDGNGRELLARRSELILLAVQDHEAARFHASIPVILAQIEGLVIDVSGGKRFFSERADLKADMVDSRGIATLPAALDTVRKIFSESADTSRLAGSVSRHGILHGRELAYGTRANSAKAFALLQGVVEWAQGVSSRAKP